MSLWDLSENQFATISGFADHFSAPYQQRLKELGFEKNQDIYCLRKSRLQAACTYQIGDSVFSLAKDVAQSVIIKG